MVRIKAINEWMKAYAAKEKHVYLDYFVPAMIDETGHLRTELSADDLHPNAQGYAVMGPLAESRHQAGAGAMLKLVAECGINSAVQPFDSEFR